MGILPYVVRAEYRGGHRIHLVPHDGRDKAVDFWMWLVGPVFEPLRDAGYFQRFFLEAGTVTWHNGADIAPETPYGAQGVEEAASRRCSRRTSRRRPAKWRAEGGDVGA